MSSDIIVGTVDEIIWLLLENGNLDLSSLSHIGFMFWLAKDGTNDKWKICSLLILGIVSILVSCMVKWVEEILV